MVGVVGRGELAVGVLVSAYRDWSSAVTQPAPSTAAAQWVSSLSVRKFDGDDIFGSSLYILGGVLNDVTRDSPARGDWLRLKVEIARSGSRAARATALAHFEGEDLCVPAVIAALAEAIVDDDRIVAQFALLTIKENASFAELTLAAELVRVASEEEHRRTSRGVFPLSALVAIAAADRFTPETAWALDLARKITSNPDSASAPVFVDLVQTVARRGDAALAVALFHTDENELAGLAIEAIVEAISPPTSPEANESLAVLSRYLEGDGVVRTSDVRAAFDRAVAALDR